MASDGAVHQPMLLGMPNELLVMVIEELEDTRPLRLVIKALNDLGMRSEGFWNRLGKVRLTADSNMAENTVRLGSRLFGAGSPTLWLLKCHKRSPTLSIHFNLLSLPSQIYSNYTLYEKARDKFRHSLLSILGEVMAENIDLGLVGPLHGTATKPETGEIEDHLVFHK
ncbi:hypothetical protein E8E13_008557 [Curvularia kusanoi]|uniref:Uncharacterized protein n=1 Tax=Curvularia kusanoi TaxID=90978 RepID=A0A9P4TBM0_CURKU|nr:hypothetical protein E8E13_008557 [Curvularia kusanoi]